jgi:hypothetical protein
MKKEHEYLGKAPVNRQDTDAKTTYFIALNVALHEFCHVLAAGKLFCLCSTHADK